MLYLQGQDFSLTNELQLLHRVGTGPIACLLKPCLLISVKLVPKSLSGVQGQILYSLQHDSVACLQSTLHTVGAELRCQDHKLARLRAKAFADLSGSAEAARSTP